MITIVAKDGRVFFDEVREGETEEETVNRILKSSCISLKGIYTADGVVLWKE